MVIKHVVLPWNTAWWPSRFLLSSIFSVAYQLKWNIYMTFKLENSSIASSRHSSLQLTSSLSGLQKKRARGDVMKVQLNVMKVWHLFVCHVFVTPHRCDVFVCWHFSSLLRSRSFSRPLNDMPRGLLSQSVSVFFSFFMCKLKKCTKNRLMKTYQLWWARTESSTGAQQLSEARFSVNGQLLFWGEVKKKKGKRKKGAAWGILLRRERKRKTKKRRESSNRLIRWHEDTEKKESRDAVVVH